MTLETLSRPPVVTEAGLISKTSQKRPTSEVRLPDGSSIWVKGLKRQQILKGLIEAGETGINPLDYYPNTSDPKTAELNVENHVTRLKRQLSEEQTIILRRTVDGFARFIFTSTEELGKSVLPNGEIVNNLTPQSKELLQHLIDTNLPAYMADLAQSLKPKVEFVNAKKALKEEFYRINKSLNGTGTKIKRATKYHTPNPAYYLAMDNAEEKISSPLIKADDAYINQRIDKITNLLEAQRNNKPITLTDEINTELHNELQQLEEEMELRRRIEEEKRAKIREWNKNQHRPNNKAGKPKLELEHEVKHPASVKQTRVQYHYDGKGLTNEILDNAGYRALEEARKRYDEASGVSFERYAEFWIRGAMGNMLLYNSPEAPQANEKLPIQAPESIAQFRESVAIALIDLSNPKKYSRDTITPDESRALDIMLGITGKNPGSSEDVAYELDSSIPWAERLARTGMEKLINSLHAPTLAKYFSA